MIIVYTIVAGIDIVNFTVHMLSFAVFTSLFTAAVAFIDE